MTRKLRTALTAVLILGLIAGAAGSVAASSCAVDVDQSDDDHIDIDDNDGTDIDNSRIIIIDKNDSDFIDLGLNLLS